jgi:hypothetical protein
MTITMYVARDRLFNGLYLHAGIPVRRHGVFVSARGAIELPADSPDYAELKHTDDPVEVKIEISLA